jgi:hypothetical protein
VVVVRRHDDTLGAPLRDGFDHHHWLCGLLHQRTEMLVEDRPVRQVAEDVAVQASQPVDVVVAVERLMGSCCYGGCRRGLLYLLDIVVVEADPLPGSPPPPDGERERDE